PSNTRRGADVPLAALGAGVPANRVEPVCVDQGLARGGRNRGSIFAVRPHRLALPALLAVDLEGCGVVLLDELERKVRSLEEVRGLVQHGSRVLVRDRKSVV